MADGKELKPRSFRIDDETTEKFKEISAGIGGNQQETLAKLIEAYEFQKGKANLTDRKQDIEQFERYVTIITNMYMGALEDNQNITETVRAEFDSLLKSKDTVIQDLQTQLAEAKKKVEESDAVVQSHQSENERLTLSLNNTTNEYHAKVSSMQLMLDDKENLNKALSESYNSLKEKVESMKNDVAQIDSMKKELMQKERDSKAANEKAVELERKLRQLKEQSQLDLERKVLEMEKEHQAQIQQLKEEKQNEIDKYQKKYYEILERMQEEKKP